MLSDIEIFQKTKMSNIKDIAHKLNINENEIELYGNYCAKLNNVNLDASNGKLILVTSINPTMAGEGKSTTSVGLIDSFNYLGYKTIGALREPSLGPVFGSKGGAAGGGYAQVVPMDKINLHFTGDIHALTTAHNLIAAALDNHLYQGNELKIEIDKIYFNRALDMSDRTLRSITIGQDKKINGIERNSGFIITVASELMAILCLSESFNDLEKRVNKIIIA